MSTPTAKQKEISDLLRSADKTIKDGKLDAALQAINKVFELDQRNVYARAYQERILSLKEAEVQEKSRAQKISYEAPPDIETKPVQQAAPQFSSAHTTTIKRSPAALEAYTTLLTEIWADGAVAPEEHTRINSMRETFAITTEEHRFIEQSVRLETYLNAIRSAYQKGITHFDDLRKRFNFSEHEHLAIEGKVNQLLQSLQSKGTVLLIDDEEPFLQTIQQILLDSGYTCVTCTNGEDAFEILYARMPDVVLCDINFMKPHMSGFAFYEKFRSVDAFNNIPFIFLSGLDQEVLIRTGLKMGADDYITKPIEPELLLAVLEGKLKRYREIQRKTKK